MKSKIFLFAFSLILLPAIHGFSQETIPDLPVFKPYKGIPGKVTKYNNFNFIDILDVGGGKKHQAMGNYWEVAYTYDSVFRQRKKFRDFVVNQIVENKGELFLEDTLQVNFVIPAETGNIWGRLVLASDKVYRLRVIREIPFEGKIAFDTKPVAVYEKFVDPVVLPQRLNYMPASVITRVQYSKFDHQEFTWNVKDTLFRQKTMGPFWDLKIDIRNSSNLVDKQVSSVEIMENYYRACVKSGGKIIKSRPRELIFTLPLTKATLWCRITISLDGVYFVRALVEADQDKTIPEKMVNVSAPPADSTQRK